MLFLIFSELQKLLRLRVLTVTFALLLILNGTLTHWQAEQTRQIQPWSAEEAEAVYALSPTQAETLAAYADELRAYENLQRKADREESVETLQGIYTDGLYTDDLALIEYLQADAALPAKFEKTMQAAITNAQINYREALYRGEPENGYSCQYQLRMEALYQTVLNTVELPVTYRYGWNEYYSFELAGVVSLLMAIMIASAAFILEKDVGMFPLVRVSRKGRMATVTAKIVAVCVLAVLGAVVFSLEAFAIFGITLGYSDPSCPIQAIEVLRLSWLTLSLGEYFWLHLGLRVLGAVAITFPVMLLSVVFFRYILTYAASITLFGVHYYCYLGQGWHKTNILRYINLLAIADGVRATERYDATNFSDQVCGYLTAALVLAIGGALICTVGISLFYCCGFEGMHIKWLPMGLERLKRLVPRFALPRSQPLRQRTMSLYLIELYKLWIASRLWIVIVLLLLADGVFFWRSSTIHDAHSYMDSLYESYVNALEGPWSTEKEELLVEFWDEQEAIRANYPNIQQKYRDGELTSHEFLTYQRAFYQVSACQSVIRSLQDHAQYLRQRQNETGVIGEFFYETGWQVLFDRQADLFLYAMLLVLLPGVWTQEYARNRFAVILHTTAEGREGVFLSKLGAVLTSAMLLSGVTQLLHWGIVAYVYQLPLPDAKLWSMESYADASSSLTLGQYLCLHGLTRLAAALALALLVMVVAVFLRRTLAIMASVAAVTLLPTVIGNLGITFLATVDFIQLFSGQSILLVSMKRDWFGWDWGLLVVTLIALGGMITVLLLIARRNWCGMYRLNRLKGGRL